MKKTKGNYEQYLNEISPSQDSDEWIIGGKNRHYSSRGRYGFAIRSHDPIAFEVGFSEWSRLSYE